MPLPTPRLLEFPAGEVTPYAHHYRFGPGGIPAPLVVYVGGAITRRVYEERRATAPNAVATPFEEAVRATGCPAVDLLVLPCPVSTGDSGPDWILEHLDEQLLPSLSAPPTSLGCVGYSAGAGYATHLAIFGEARGLAVLGAAGLWRTVATLRPELEARVRVGAPPLEALWAMNADDEASQDVCWLGHVPPALRFERRMGAGAHRFADYAANGLAAAAFRFVLSRLLVVAA